MQTEQYVMNITVNQYPVFALQVRLASSSPTEMTTLDHKIRAVKRI
ncbi:hypothetical protein [Brenneria goodwinii]|nr:hypothetical protein [Brenneria goodwinii]